MCKFVKTGSLDLFSVTDIPSDIKAKMCPQLSFLTN